MTDANKALAHRWFDEVWNHGNVATVDELFAPNGKSHGFPEPGAVLTGPADFKAVHRTFHDAFSNIHVHLDEVLAEGDSVAVRWTATMKHTGDALGFPASQRDVKFAGASFICVKHGKITDGWNLMDFTHVTRDLQAR